MSARAGKFALAGLCALTLSCAGLQKVAALSTGNGNLGEVVKHTTTAVQRYWDAGDCEKLRARVSFDEERALGGAVALNWVTGGKGLLRTDARGTTERDLQEYINTVGRNLAAQSPRPTLPWTFGVLKAANAYNAASAPGGYVFVTRGLLQDVENEAQLAGVLAHEIAHVTLHHALTRYDDEKVGQCKMVAYGEALRDVAPEVNSAWVGLFRAALQGGGGLDLDHNVDLLAWFTRKTVEKLVTEGFAKEDEFAADRQAVHLLLSAGYDPREYIRFLGKLRGGDSGYAHHPGTAERQARLRQQLANTRPREEEFPELPTTGLQKPALPPAFAAVRGGP